MPRQASLDAPNTLDSDRVRGSWRGIFQEDVDRTEFVARLAAVAERGTSAVYSWALLPNHAHLLVCTGQRQLPRSMRSLLAAAR